MPNDASWRARNMLRSSFLLWRELASTTVAIRILGLTDAGGLLRPSQHHVMRVRILKTIRKINTYPVPLYEQPESTAG